MFLGDNAHTFNRKKQFLRFATILNFQTVYYTHNNYVTTYISCHIHFKVAGYIKYMNGHEKLPHHLLAFHDVTLNKLKQEESNPEANPHN